MQSAAALRLDHLDHEERAAVEGANAERRASGRMIAHAEIVGAIERRR